ncbi:MAG TPA: hypothetical protein VGP17_14700 [Solirubrobacteraceae bacterium]|nr:hypothetical protein [Solirubrobacteraceae bacterium]
MVVLKHDLVGMQSGARCEDKIVETVDQTGTEQPRKAVRCRYRVSDHPGDLINRPRPLRTALK